MIQIPVGSTARHRSEGVAAVEESLGAEGARIEFVPRPATAKRAFNNTIVVVGLPPGQHQVLIELADSDHHIFIGQTVTFTVPGPTR